MQWRGDIVAATLPALEDREALICVVDDDEFARVGLGSLLRSMGYAVEAFDSATQFIASGRVSHASCIVLDVCMPRMTGPELQRRLKEEGHAVPIVFLSGQRDARIRERTLGDGAIDFLHKPFDEERLVAALDRALASAPQPRRDR